MEERGGGLGGGEGGGGMQGPSGFYVVAPHFNTKLMVRPPPPTLNLLPLPMQGVLQFEGQVGGVGSGGYYCGEL